MSQGGRDRLLTHSADGIEEYDNPLPGWWVWLFWATIVFSAGYWSWYQLGPGPSVVAEYEAETRVATEREARQVAAAGAPSDEALRALAKNGAAMTAARQIFETRCAACHGAQGQGIIGPNLTDEYWIHGGVPTFIRRIVESGVPDKGMVPWKGQLSPQEISAVTAYVLTLAGSNPPNPRPPQGTKAGETPDQAARR